MSKTVSKEDGVSHVYHPELIIGMVGAVGTDLSHVSDILQQQLKNANYNVHIISISKDVIEDFQEVTYNENSEYDRISKLMTAGNQLCENTEDSSILARGAIAKINEIRLKETGEPTKPLESTAFIIRSLKRPKELSILRKTYPGGFISIGVFAEEKWRINSLEEKSISKKQAEELIQRDANEKHIDFGQRLTKTFYLSDFFVHLDKNALRIKSEIKRIVELLFGHPYKTPSFDEYAMFLAFAAALRSADLSRQVGAVIAKNNQILATGANDCPKAGGGLYWPERNKSHELVDTNEGRDYMRGADSNRIEQDRMIEKICELAKTNEIDPIALKRTLSDKQSPIRDLTEYGRVVHAEMDALTSCARSHLSTQGATLYCTTFPCHNCAKHIIAAGIARVVYIEPYEKSKAPDFHSDSVIFGFLDDNDDEKVRFEPFVGVGPRQFFDLFSMVLSSGYDIDRKGDDGKTVEPDIKSNFLRLNMSPLTYLDYEVVSAEKYKSQISLLNNEGETHGE